MQIKKFEARTMKEALEMVKSQLGPDAVILSAKEVTKGFGLGGAKSIEITAAYSETVLQNKKYVEARMPDYLKEQFGKTSARKQKETIQSAYTKIQSQAIKTEQLNKVNYQQTIPHQRTQRRYADIDREDQITASAHTTTNIASSIAASNAKINNLTQVAQKTFNTLEVDQLKNEIEMLKNLITTFKQIPQNYVQAHPGADYGVNYNLSAYFQMLTQKGLTAEMAAEILVQAQTQITPDKQMQKQIIEAYIARFILKATNIAQENFEQFHLFLGPSGSGKTTSMIKYASDLMLNHGKKVALISTDTLKIGADEQMQIYSRILNLPFISIRSEADWYKIVPYLNQVDHVLVDYASLNLKNQEELTYIQKMLPPVHDSLRTHLVLSAMSKDVDLLEVHRRYQSLKISDVIFTSLDEASLHGNIYNFTRKTNMPLFAFGIGSRTPEDFEKATAERVLDLILEITKSNRHHQVENQP